MATGEISDGDLERAIDELYGLPFDAFIAGRDALAKRLASAGRKPERTRVVALRKPNATAWVANQLVRRAPKELAALREVGETQRRTVAKGGGVTEQMATRKAVRGAVDALLARAESLVATGEVGSAEVTVERLRSTLEAVAAWGLSAQAPPLGRLTKEVEHPGFAALDDLLLAAVNDPTATEEDTDDLLLGRQQKPGAAAPSSARDATQTSTVPAPAAPTEGSPSGSPQPSAPTHGGETMLILGRRAKPAERALDPARVAVEDGEEVLILGRRSRPDRGVGSASPRSTAGPVAVPPLAADGSRDANLAQASAAAARRQAEENLVAARLAHHNAREALVGLETELVAREAEIADLETRLAAAERTRSDLAVRVAAARSNVELTSVAEVAAVAACPPDPENPTGPD